MHLRASITLGLLGGFERPPDPRSVVLSTYGAQWTYSLLAPVKFRAGSAPVLFMTGQEMIEMNL